MIENVENKYELTRLGFVGSSVFIPMFLLIGLFCLLSPDLEISTEAKSIIGQEKSVTSTNIVTPAEYISLTTNSNNLNPILMTDSSSDDQVDLEVSKFVSPSSPMEGELITYTVVVTNNGPITATNVRITDTLPNDLTLAGYSLSSSPYGQTYSLLTGLWEIGTLGDDSSATLKLIARVNLNTNGNTIINTASELTSDNVDYNPSNNSASVSFIVGKAADLQIRKTDYQSSLSPGDEFTYTIFITNAGSIKASGIVITDVLPTYLSYVTDTLQNLGITYTIPTAKTYRWDYPYDIEAGDVVTYELGVEAASSMTGSSQVNTVKVSTESKEGDKSNNSSSDTDTIKYTPSVSFSKSVSPTEQKLNGYITFFIYVTNNSSVPISSVLVKDTFSILYLDIFNVSTTKGSVSYNISTNLVTASIGTMSAEQSVTITVLCRVIDKPAETTDFTNYAYLTFYYGGDSYSKHASVNYRISHDISSSMSFSKSVYPPEAKLDDDFTFFIFVTNESEYPISNIIVLDYFSPYLNIFGISSSRGTSSFDNSLNKATINLDSLNPGSSATISIYCKVENVEALTISLYNNALMTYIQNGQSMSIISNSVLYKITGLNESLFLPLILNQ